MKTGKSILLTNQEQTLKITGKSGISKKNVIKRIGADVERTFKSNRSLKHSLPQETPV